MKIKLENKIVTFLALVLITLFIVSCTAPNAETVKEQVGNVMSQVSSEVQKVVSFAFDKNTEDTEAEVIPLALTAEAGRVDSEGNTLVYSDSTGTLVNQAKTEPVPEPVNSETRPFELEDLSDFTCKEFKDNLLLWSSGYTTKNEGSTNYDTWEIGISCEEAGGYGCLLHNITLNTRFIYTNPNNTNSTGESNSIGEGYVQISDPDETICNNPEQATYSKYLAYDTPKEGEKEWKGYCGKNKNLGSKCGVEISDNYDDNVICYGIKTYASQYSIVDVVEIKYEWCWENIN